MIDKVLGFDQPAPRRRPNQTQQNSNKQDQIDTSITSPARSIPKKTFSEERDIAPAKPEQAEEPVPITKSTQKSKLVSSRTVPRNEAKQETKNESEEQISSPAVKNIKMARIPKTNQQMRNSTRIDVRASSLRVSQIHTAPSGDDTMYKLKLLAFIIISFLMTLYAMTPARKAPGPKR